MLSSWLPWKRNEVSATRVEGPDIVAELQHPIDSLPGGGFPGLFPVIPRFDLVETSSEYTITAEMPGVRREDLQITLDGSILRVRGEKKEEQEKDRLGLRVSERHYGMFERSVRLPDTVDTAALHADFSNGILTLRIPWKPGARKGARKIEISD